LGLSLFCVGVHCFIIGRAVLSLTKNAAAKRQKGGDFCGEAAREKEKFRRLVIERGDR